jgi:hypothetical protein
MEPTKEEYNHMSQKIEKRMRFKKENYTKETIDQLVDKHFSIFLNKAEQQAIIKIIIQNFKENHGYTEGQPLLPNGNRIYWEIQIIACDRSTPFISAPEGGMKTINKLHMEKWYTQDYCSQIANIIKSKRL